MTTLESPALERDRVALPVSDWMPETEGTLIDDLITGLNGNPTGCDGASALAWPDPPRVGYDAGEAGRFRRAIAEAIDRHLSNDSGRFLYAARQKDGE